MSETWYAVLTGDVVKSSALMAEDRGRVPESLRAAADLTTQHFPDAVHGAMDIFRGDSWQMVVSRPRLALRVGLFLRAALLAQPGGRPIDTRVAVGFGTVAYLPENNVSTGNGQAFNLSGEALEAAGKTCRLSVSFPEPLRSPLTHSLTIIVRLIDLQAQRWTRKQAEAVSGAVLGLTQQSIGKGWFREPVTQQAISQHLEGAGWAAISQGVNFFESVLPDLREEIGAA